MTSWHSYRSGRTVARFSPSRSKLRQDWATECIDDVKDSLWLHFHDQIERGILAGFPGWYKDQLLQKQFAEQEPAA